MERELQGKLARFFVDTGISGTDAVFERIYAAIGIDAS